MQYLSSMLSSNSQNLEQAKPEKSKIEPVLVKMDYLEHLEEILYLQGQTLLGIIGTDLTSESLILATQLFEKLKWDLVVNLSSVVKEI